MEKIAVKVTCPRCGGRGFSEAWSFTGLTCWQCGGEGYIFQEQKIYTPEEQAKIDAREAKRLARLGAKAEERARNEAIRIENETRFYLGFADKKIAYNLKG